MNNFDIPKFKAMFFDWDNTLVDAWPILFKATNATLKHFGHPQITLEEVKIRARFSTRESFPKLYGDKWKEAQSLFYQVVFESKYDLKLYDGVLSLLELLKESGYSIAIISNKRNDLLREEIDRLKVKCDLILGSGDSTHDKPHPEMGLIALNHFNLQTNEAVYIGDSITDWVFAKNLDMPAIAIGDDAYEGQLLARFNTVNEAIMQLFNTKEDFNNVLC